MMRQDRQKGLVAKGQVRPDPAVVSSSATQVVIRDCSDDSHWLLYTRDGRPENDVPGGHHRIDATVVLRSNRWRVESLYVHEMGSC